MVDLMLNAPLKLTDGGQAGPTLMVRLRQVQAVEDLFKASCIRYSRSRHAVQPYGAEPVVLVEFGARGDSARIQALLDEH